MSYGKTLHKAAVPCICRGGDGGHRRRHGRGDRRAGHRRHAGQSSLGGYLSPGFSYDCVEMY
jgi:hypothetical protein